jgi:hypothetical protein
VEFDAFLPILPHPDEMKEVATKVWIWAIIVMVLLGLVMKS